MPKKKADWLKEAQDLGLDVTSKNTVAQIQTALKQVAVKADKPLKDKANDEEPAPQVAKAGKRSKKALAEAEIKAAKEARKRGEDDDEAVADAPPAVKKGPAPVTRSRLARRSKKYRSAYKKIDKTKEYTVAEALKLAVDMADVKFDATVELHVRLNADPKQADQNIRETVVLPSGSGKTLRVAVFAEPADQTKAKQAGADLVGEKELLNQLEKEQLDFDVLIATPQLMSQLGRFAKLLGPKGLMPNPKSGTVTKNVVQAVKQAKAGRVEFRIDKEGIIHVGIGKVSFGPDKLLANAQAVLSAIKSAKPASIKSQYVTSAFVASTMGPSIRLALSELFNQPAETNK